jgi:amino acid adenylation domain-containing protein/thioester reductase-like protein
MNTPKDVLLRRLAGKSNIEAIYPLSPMQEGMLFHALYAPSSGLYFEQWLFTFQGALDVPTFKQGWQRVIERHPVLRTLFVWERREKPLQVVRQYVELPWEQHNLSGLSSLKQQEWLETWLREDREQGFDLSKAPLTRLTLFQVAEGTHYFVWSFHHLLLDGWSVSLVLKEVLSFYEAFRQGQNLYLDRSRPYRDYIAWLQQQDLSKAEAFWRWTLKGFTSPTPLTVDRARSVELKTESADRAQEYAEQQLRLPEAITTGLQSIAREHQLTLNTLIQGAWALLLSRYSSEEEVVFGATVSGRPADLVGVEGMVGLFINTLPVRVRVSSHCSLLPWLKEIQTRHVEARQYEYSPLVEIQGWSDVHRGLSLFDSILVFENYPREVGLQPWRGSLQIRDVRYFGRTNYPLTIGVMPGTELLLEINYDCLRFDAATVTRMMGHFQTLLEGIATANTDQRLSDLSLLAEAERHQLLAEWNATRSNYPGDLCLHELFENQMEQTPDAVAVIFEEESLTYRELNHRANQLAHYLQSLGVGPEVLVGIYVDRSLEMVVGMLGVLKAGGAYLPLDPAYPKPRLAFMLADAQVPVLLTQQRMVAGLPSHEAQVICLDADWSVIARERVENPTTGATPDNLAYVIYTSGSTGKPKGVLLAHRGTCNLVMAQIRAFDVRPGSRILQFAPFGFDASVSEVFTTLLAGATLCLSTHDSLLPGPALTRLLYDLKVTTVTLPPSSLAVLPAAELPALRTIISAGEPCSPDIVARWGAGRVFLNAYGPSEATVCATIATCSDSDQKPPIGRAIDNTQVYILDTNLQPVPVGVAGELYIAGVGLARGYLNRPELTAEKFIPNPFSSEPGARLYRTGDLARYLPDGNIEFLCRTDYQVKVRGFRIELGEIEAVLAGHPAVQEAVVITRDDIPGDKRLVAYFVAAHEPAPTPSELRSILKETLPDYMVPSAFVKVEAIPLMPNGKVNRRALPALDTNRPEMVRAYVAPRNSTEELLAHIWAKILGLEQVGVYDDFFELGGHSLLATRLVFQVREAFQVELSLPNFFENATIAGLAQAIAIVQQPHFGTAETTMPVPDLAVEASLDPCIRPEPGSVTHVTEADAILLTGATGFLGAFLLYELLQQTHADILCLVRASDTEAGQRRIQKRLEAYSLWQQNFISRIIPVVGDLSQPYLGLSTQQFRALAGQIDVIYHNGALVNFVYPYERLKPANVLGTQEILSLASQTRTLPVHYISTLSVFSKSSYYGSQPIREEEEPKHIEGLRSGYVQSKWVAERLVTEARDRGLPVGIYRLGAVIGDSHTGVWSTDDYVSRFIKGCIQLGSIPDQDKMWQLTPVDYVAKVIVHLSRRPMSLGKAFHVLSPYHFHQSQLADWVCALGYELHRLPYNQWLAELKKVAQRSPEQALYPLLPVLAEEASLIEEELQFDSQNLLDGLAGTGITCPPVDVELLGTYFSYFIRSGFLEAPLPDGKLEYISKARAESS